MSVVKGLKSANKFMERHAPKGDGEDRPKARWLKLADGESVSVTFLQELDPESPLYNAEAGVAFIAPEHSSPTNYRKKALCTQEDEGRCVGCEMFARGDYDWKVKGRFYANVLVDDGINDPYVAIMSQGTSGKTITPSLYMMAGEAGSITDKNFRIKRNGAGKKTEYQIVPSFAKKDQVDVSKYTLYDLEAVCTRSVPYEKQTEFYEISAAEEEPESADDFSW
jgi:hypothetical protein